MLKELVHGQGFVSKIWNMRYFIDSLQVNNEGVKMTNFGFGTSECRYCGYKHYRIEMVKDPEFGWYKEKCKQIFCYMVNELTI